MSGCLAEYLKTVSQIEKSREILLVVHNDQFKTRTFRTEVHEVHEVHELELRCMS